MPSENEYPERLLWFVSLGLVNSMNSSVSDGPGMSYSISVMTTAGVPGGTGCPRPMKVMNRAEMNSNNERTVKGSSIVKA
jgi:hypothetical protein